MYFIVSKENAVYNENTGHWYVDLPDDFVNTHRDRKITVINFSYFVITKPRTTTLNTNIEFTSLHSPTLIDGNFNQYDNYICGLCKNYTYNTIYKSYPIKTRPQGIEFWFKNANGEMVTEFDYTVTENGDDVIVTENFIIELNLEVLLR